MKRKHRLIFFSIISLLILSFIFGNSLQSREESSKRSSGIADLLRPLLDPFGWLTEDTFHHLIRKLAHFTEFSILGMCLSGIAVNTAWQGSKRWAMPVLWSFAAALTDENIQRFTGRACQFKDVMLDLIGAIFGITLVFLVIWLRYRYRGKKNV